MNRMTDLSKAPEQLTEAKLRERLGNYVAPRGLYEQNKAKSFVGAVVCNVNRPIAGDWTEIFLDY